MIGFFHGAEIVSLLWCDTASLVPCSDCISVLSAWLGFGEYFFSLLYYL